MEDYNRSTFPSSHNKLEAHHAEREKSMNIENIGSTLLPL